LQIGAVLPRFENDFLKKNTIKNRNNTNFLSLVMQYSDFRTSKAKFVGHCGNFEIFQEKIIKTTRFAAKSNCLMAITFLLALVLEVR
jgi:hypothetical protein